MTRITKIVLLAVIAVAAVLILIGQPGLSYYRHWQYNYQFARGEQSDADNGVLFRLRGLPDQSYGYSKYNSRLKKWSEVLSPDLSTRDISAFSLFANSQWHSMLLYYGQSPQGVEEVSDMLLATPEPANINSYELDVTNRTQPFPLRDLEYLLDQPNQPSVYIVFPIAPRSSFGPISGLAHVESRVRALIAEWMAAKKSAGGELSAADDHWFTMRLYFLVSIYYFNSRDMSDDADTGEDFQEEP